ncbi:hypothetical protein AVEN_226427-1 [Araneus ventricosus]|uniref:Uncharacterized protein n=1 Tax=Araneus ventricosus TaxID=182803 RepID=A0A4Y2CF75_ARAVE|nr:hypothetical protein AVEN_226427-1 [Araneus ventricosus]
MLIDEFQGLHSLSISSIMKQVNEKLSLSISKDQLHELTSLVQNSDLLTYCNNNFLKTDYLRKKFYKSNFMYVEPIQIYLGRNKYRKHCYAQYVPIKETLKSLFKQEQVYSQLTINHDNLEPGIFSDIVNGSVYRNNALFKNASNAIQILLYQDAFEIVNPLGSARKKHKIVGVYMTLGNVMPHQRLNIDFIQLVLLCKENDLKFFGQEKLFSKLVSDLKDLENGGFQINDTVIKGTVLSIIGDNLGSHTIGGFSESFIVENFCRYCDIRKNMLIQKPYCTGDFRTPESYDSIVEQKQDNVIVDGIK